MHATGNVAPMNVKSMLLLFFFWFLIWTWRMMSFPRCIPLLLSVELAHSLSLDWMAYR